MTDINFTNTIDIPLRIGILPSINEMEPYYLISSHTQDKFIQNDTSLDKICICCSSQNVNFVNLSTCKHTTFLKNITKVKVNICYGLLILVIKVIILSIYTLLNSFFEHFHIKWLDIDMTFCIGVVQNGRWCFLFCNCNEYCCLIVLFILFVLFNNLVKGFVK